MSRDDSNISTISERMRRIVAKCTLVTRSELPKTFHSLLQRQGPTTVGFLNQHGYNLARSKEETFMAFDSLDVIFRDGIGMALACRSFGLDPKENLNGTDLIPSFLNYASEALGSRAQYFAYGTVEPWLSKGGNALFAGEPFEALNGFQSVKRYVTHFESRRNLDTCAIVILGMGMPKQEIVARAISRSKCGNVILICGGAILDFSAGRFSRAPKLVRSLRMEWFYRLVMEPKRLLSRYIIGIPRFLCAIAIDSPSRRD